MELKEFVEELKEAKHSYIDIFFLNQNVAVKGILKNIVGELEASEDKYIEIAIKEIKSDEQVLEDFKCKNSKKDKKGGEGKNKDRKIIKIGNVEDLKKLEKTVTPLSKRYKLELGADDIGIVVYNKKEEGSCGA